MTLIKAVLREPLVQFGALALLIFAAYGLLAPASAPPADTEITISAPKVAQMAEIFARTWQRPPTDAELAALIDDYVNEEIFVREALSLGLDQGDTVIRRRLRQKIEFLQDAEAEAVAPTEIELAAWLADHPEPFAVDPLVTFQQVFLSPDRRGEAVRADAQAVLATLTAHPEADASLLADPSMLPAAMDQAPMARISASFGPDFADALRQAPLGQWSGPVSSAFGLHILRVTALVPGRVPPLDDVRSVVLREWTRARADAAADAHLAELRSRYQITIDQPVAAKP